jgi:hypothetical protein
MTFTIWKALLGLAGFDLLLLGGGFATVYRVVRRRALKGSMAGGDVAEQVCNAVNRACVWYPKRALCLQRAAVTTCLLRGGGVPAQMVIGAKKLPFRAHAWVEVDGRVLNERIDVRSAYTVWDRC